MKFLYHYGEAAGVIGCTICRALWPGIIAAPPISYRHDQLESFA